MSELSGGRRGAVKARGAYFSMRFVLLLLLIVSLSAADLSIVEARLKKNPQDVALKNELAGSYLQKMRETADSAYMERAQRLVSEVLRADRDNYEARRRQIEIELQRHHFRQVISLAKDLAKIRSEDPVVLGLMGDAMMELGEYDDAAETYQKMADLRPGLASYNRIAFYRFVTGDAEGAIEIMRKGVRIGAATPENLAWCLSDLGMMHYKAGQLDEAEKSFRAALDAFPKYHHALAGSGYVLAARGKFNDAIDAFRQAQNRAPFPEYTSGLAKLYRRIGKNELAERQVAMLEVAAKLDEASGEIANRNLALAFADLDGQGQRALKIAQAELKIRQDVYSWDAFAWALFKSGDTQQAAEAIRKALCQNTPEPLFHRHAARIFEALGESETAQHHNERAAALNPGYVIL